MNLKEKYLADLKTFLHLRVKRGAKSLVNTSQIKKVKKALLDYKLKKGGDQ